MSQKLNFSVRPGDRAILIDAEGVATTVLPLEQAQTFFKWYDGISSARPENTCSLDRDSNGGVFYEWESREGPRYHFIQFNRELVERLRSEVERASGMIDLHVELTVLERGQEVESVLRFFASLGLKGLTDADNGMLLVTQEQWKTIDSFQMDDANIPCFCYPNAWDLKPGDGSEPSPEMAAAIAALPRLER